MEDVEIDKSTLFLTPFNKSQNVMRGHLLQEVLGEGAEACVVPGLARAGPQLEVVHVLAESA